MARKKKRGRKKRNSRKVAPAAASCRFSEIEEAFFASEVQPIDECDEPFPTWRDRIRAIF